jgi:hypothetical protein
MATLNVSSGFPAADPLEQMARDDREDWVLLRLVVCVAIATIAMAIATTLPM